MCTFFFFFKWNEGLTSSNTSRTAAPHGSSSGSIPPPGTIHWSGCRLLLTSITFQQKKPSSGLCCWALDVQKHTSGLPRYRVPHHYWCLVAKFGATHSTGCVGNISHLTCLLNAIWVWCGLVLSSLHTLFHISQRDTPESTDSKCWVSVRSKKSKRYLIGRKENVFKGELKCPLFQ